MKVYVVSEQCNACNAGEETQSVSKVYAKEEDAKAYCDAGNAKVVSCYSTTYEYEGFEVE